MRSDDVAVIAECIATAHQALEAMTNKFESQEKEIDYLKKNALAQEIKINDLKKKADEYKRRRIVFYSPEWHRLHTFPMRADLPQVAVWKMVGPRVEV